MTAILFRGGMCGDLILGMIDPNSVKQKTGYNDKITDSGINAFRFKPARYIMKKFHLYDNDYKKNYNPNLQDVFSSIATCFAIDKSIKSKKWEKII